MKKLLFFIVYIIPFLSLANVEVPKIFSNGMVLQRNQEIPVWGWADAGEKIEVRLKDQVVKTTAGPDGKWRLILKPEGHGGPFLMEIKGNNNIEISDVYIGEVWVCSGQSNMEWTVSNSLNAEEEIADSDYPLIRQFLVEKDMASRPKEKLEGGQWEVSNYESVGDFTAVGYFFARKIHEELGMPVGIINTSWGGTNIETWISENAMSHSDEFSKVVANLPKIDMDSLREVQKQKVVNRIESLQGNKISELNESEVTSLDFKDENWPEMRIPDLWENQQFPNLDGVVWFRKTINISEEDLNKSAVLRLGKIDDLDETYVNGVLIGTTNQYDQDRIYKVPADVLKKGKNVIAVKVTDYAGGGGIYGDPANVSLGLANKNISLAGNWKFNVEEINIQFSPNTHPSLLFNAMVHPLIPYGIKGALWYQGESNVQRAVQYKKAFPLLIKDWRSHWNQGAFPFYFVQLSSFDESGGDSNKGSKWAELREAQTYTLENVENTGMAVTTDIGNATDIHPRNKQDVGKRLAAIALSRDYGRQNMFSGPKYDDVKKYGDEMVLSFEYVGKGLKIGNVEKQLIGFEIAGKDRKFYEAKAKIEGDKVVVYSENVSEPVAVRYAWADEAGIANLFNVEGFPAIPFRTDDWELSTSGTKYNVEF